MVQGEFIVAMSNTAKREPLALPFISTMIVVRNEESTIRQCVLSLLKQTYPNDRYEVLLIDGESQDRTVEEAKAAWKEYHLQDPSIPELRILDNPKRILASGWNIGIRNAVGEYVIRLDAHTCFTSDYLIKAIRTTQKVRDAACVGGVLITLARTKKAEIIAEALSSPFGVGGSRFRVAGKSGYVDTVPYGLYRREVFDEIGYFNEALIRTQDNELHRRMRDAGLKLYLDQELHSGYYCRESIWRLAKQQFQNGKWTMINFRLKPGKMAIRHFVPFLFVSALAITSVGCLFSPLSALCMFIILLLYFICAFIFAAKRSPTITHILVLPFVFFTMHISYGLGSYAGLLYKKAAEA